MAKLNTKQRAEIVTKFRTGHYSKVALADMYKTSARTVGRIVGKGKPEERASAKPKATPALKKVMTPKTTPDVHPVTGSIVKAIVDEYSITRRGVEVEVVSTELSQFGKMMVKILTGTNRGREFLVAPKDFTLVSAPEVVEAPVSLQVDDLVVANSGFYTITDENAVCKITALYDTGTMQVVIVSHKMQHRIGSSWTVDTNDFKKVGRIGAEVEPEVVEKPDEVAYSITAMAISLTVNGKGNVIDMTHPNFTQARTAILADQIELALDLMNVSKAITKFSEGKLSIVDGEVFFEGNVVQGALVDKIINLMGDGKSEFKAFAMFLERVLQNDSFKARQRLMEFAAASDIGIHTDGRLVAFKNVNEDGCSSRGGKWVEGDDGKWVHDTSQRYFHAVGEVLTMPRNEVDDNESNTCSSGLHVCSAYYLKSMWGCRGKTFKVAVCPSDIVAIPPDYKNSKARTCRYEVIEDVSGTVIEDVLGAI